MLDEIKQVKVQTQRYTAHYSTHTQATITRWLLLVPRHSVFASRIIIIIASTADDEQCSAVYCMQRALLVPGESWRESAAKQRHGLNFIGCRWLVGWLPPRMAHEHVARYLLVWAPRHLLTYVHLCICQFVSTANAHTNTHTHSASALKKWMMLLHGNSIYPFHGDFYGSSNCFSYKFTIMIIRTDWTFSF